MIHLIQCLCPERHAIFAVAYDPKEMPDDFALATFQVQIEEWIGNRIINPWCGICGSKKFTYEIAVTKFKTMEEAAPELQKAEAANLASRMIIDERRGAKN